MGDICSFLFTNNCDPSSYDSDTEEKCEDSRILNFVKSPKIKSYKTFKHAKITRTTVLVLHIMIFHDFIPFLRYSKFLCKMWPVRFCKTNFEKILYQDDAKSKHILVTSIVIYMHPK